MQNLVTYRGRTDLPADDKSSGGADVYDVELRQFFREFGGLEILISGYVDGSKEYDECHGRVIRALEAASYGVE